MWPRVRKVTTLSTPDVLERFLRYVQIDTTSDPHNDKETPSTAQQFELAKLLKSELIDLGFAETVLTDNAYVICKIPGSPGAEDAQRIALIAHIDSAPDAPGTAVKPEVITYQGGDITLKAPQDNPTVIEVKDTPDLLEMVGKEIVVSDGTTLLAADDKAGVAEIMSLCARYAHNPELLHPPLAICFTPDEEIGHGAELLDLTNLDAAWGYTVDGGALGEIEYENFNAAEAHVSFKGTVVHPGSAYQIMVNAIHLYEEFSALLPAHARPEHTKNYEGFCHVMNITGHADHVDAQFIIRSFDTEEFDWFKSQFYRAAAFLNETYSSERVTVSIRDEYANMSLLLKDDMHLIHAAEEAFTACGYTPCVKPIRGGTDGAQLSYRGLLCPNLSAGGYNFHSTREFIPVYALTGMVDVLQKLMELSVSPSGAEA